MSCEVHTAAFLVSDVVNKIYSYIYSCTFCIIFVSWFCVKVWTIKCHITTNVRGCVLVHVHVGARAAGCVFCCDVLQSWHYLSHTHTCRHDNKRIMQKHSLQKIREFNSMDTVFEGVVSDWFFCALQCSSCSASTVTQDAAAACKQCTVLSI